MFLSEREYSASKKCGEQWIIQTSKIELKHGDPIYVWVGQWEGPQKDRREGRKRQEGREICLKTVCKEFGIFLSRWGLSYNFHVSVHMPKRKQVIISVAADEWVLILCTADQTLSELSEVTPLLQSSTTVFNFEAKKHTSPTTHSCVEQNLYKFICNKTLTQVKGKINEIITGFQESSSPSLN